MYERVSATVRFFAGGGVWGLVCGVCKVCRLDGWRWELARVELCYDTWRLGSVQIAMGRGMGVFQMYVCMYVYV